MWGRQKPRNEPDDSNECYEVTLSPTLRLKLLDLLDGEKISPSDLKDIHAAVSRARKLDLADIDLAGEWAAIEVEAQRQGISVVDAWWDAAGRKRE